MAERALIHRVPLEPQPRIPRPWLYPQRIRAAGFRAQDAELGQPIGLLQFDRRERLVRPPRTAAALPPFHSDALQGREIVVLVIFRQQQQVEEGRGGGEQLDPVFLDGGADVGMRRLFKETAALGWRG